MDIVQVREDIAQNSPENPAMVVATLLEPHASPVFGGAKVVEHEVAAFRALRTLGYLSESPDEYELVERLRCTRTKARNLLYQVALRAKSNSKDTDVELREVSSQARIAKDGDFFLIEIPQPLTMDRLRRKVRSLGYLFDVSCSGAMENSSALFDAIIFGCVAGIALLVGGVKYRRNDRVASIYGFSRFAQRIVSACCRL